MSKIFQKAFHPKEKYMYTHPYIHTYVCKCYVCTYTLLNTQHTHI